MNLLSTFKVPSIAANSLTNSNRLNNQEIDSIRGYREST